MPKYYSFKYSNIDLDDYYRGLMQSAANHRTDAASLIVKAEAIEKVARNLRDDLVESVEPEKP